MLLAVGCFAMLQLNAVLGCPQLQDSTSLPASTGPSVEGGLLYPAEAYASDQKEQTGAD